jgi:hypothetical protein
MRGGSDLPVEAIIRGGVVYKGANSLWGRRETKVPWGRRRSGSSLLAPRYLASGREPSGR